MTEKQKRFCDEYLKDLNATQAAIRAGYSKKCAKQTGQRMLTYADVKEYIDKQVDGLHKESIAEADEVLRYFTSVMRGESRSQIVIATTYGSERINKPPDEKERLKAAEMLGKYHTLFTDKQKIDADLSFEVRIDYGDDAK